MNKAEPLTGEELRDAIKWAAENPHCSKWNKTPVRCLSAEKILRWVATLKAVIECGDEMDGALSVSAFCVAGEREIAEQAPEDFDRCREDHKQHAQETQQAWESLVGPYRDALEGGE